VPMLYDLCLSVFSLKDSFLGWSNYTPKRRKFVTFLFDIFNKNRRNVTFWLKSDKKNTFF
jgi:hypothetical protein